METCDNQWIVYLFEAWISQRIWCTNYSDYIGNSQRSSLSPTRCVKSTSPVTENHYKNGYVNYQNFIKTNEDINNDTKYTNKNDTNNHNAGDLHEWAQQLVVSCVSCLDVESWSSLAQVVHVSVTPSACHPWCAVLSDLVYLLFYFNLSFPVFFHSSVLMHPDLHADLDNLDSVENNLRHSAKGSLDAYDVTFSLTFYLPSVIYRALHLPVERDEKRTDNITNLSVSVLPSSRFFDSMFNHSQLRFTFLTSRWLRDESFMGPDAKSGHVSGQVVLYCIRLIFWSESSSIVILRTWDSEPRLRPRIDLRVHADLFVSIVFHSCAGEMHFLGSCLPREQLNCHVLCGSRPLAGSQTRCPWSSSEPDTSFRSRS